MEKNKEDLLEEEIENTLKRLQKKKEEINEFNNKTKTTNIIPGVNQEVEKIIFRVVEKNTAPNSLEDFEEDHESAERKLQYAFYRKDFQKVEDLLNGGDVTIDSTFMGISPLHLCITKNDVELLKFVLSKEPNFQLKNSKGDAAIHMCVSKKDLNFEILNMLLKVEKVEKDFLNDDGFSALHLSIMNYRSDIFEALLPYCDVNLAIDGLDCLHRSIFVGNLEATQKLIELGKSDLQFFNSHGEMPIHAASGLDHPEILKFLVAHDRNQLKFKTKKYLKSALHIACEKELFENVKIIFEDEPSIVNATDFYKKTPLHYASMKGNLEIVQFLVRKDVDVEALDSGNRNSLLLAADYQHKEVEEYLRKEMDVRFQEKKALIEEDARITRELEEEEKQKREEREQDKEGWILDMKDEMEEDEKEEENN